MGRLAVPVLSHEREAQLHARATAAVERTLGRMAERRSVWRGRVGGALTAAAAIAVIALASTWLLRAPRGPALASPHVVSSTQGVSVVKGSGARVPGGEGTSLSRGDELSTAAGARATLSLANHAAVEMAPETRVKIAKPPEADTKSERIELTQGEVSLQVPKLPAGSTLSVRTPDTLVIVRGTRFTVNVERGPASVVTRVSVSEGRVEVESQGRTQFLTPGERWSSAREVQVVTSQPATAEPFESTTAVDRPSREVSTQAQPGRRSERAPAHAPEAPSTLGEENGLYRDALRLARNGEAARALTVLESLLKRYPRSPLVQSARVEHFRVLVQLGNIRAAGAEARRYLSDYPSGFARAEAQQIALRGLGDAQ